MIAAVLEFRSHMMHVPTMSIIFDMLVEIFNSLFLCLLSLSVSVSPLSLSLSLSLVPSFTAEYQQTLSQALSLLSIAASESEGPRAEPPREQFESSVRDNERADSAREPAAP